METQLRDCPNCEGTGKVLDLDGPALRKLRVDAGLTQEELALCLVVTQPFISDLERGRATAGPLLQRRWQLACTAGVARPLDERRAQ